MRFSPNLKKILLIGTIVLLGCDVSMLFAAQNDEPKPNLNNDPQVQQQKQVEAQIKALQNAQPSAEVPAMPALPPSPSQNKDELLPPVPVQPPPNIPPPVYQPPAASTPLASTPAEAPAPQVSENDLNETAFNAMVQNSLPMSPAQIQKLRSVYMASQFAATSSPVTPPRPVAASVFVDLSPGSTPPVVRLAQGFVSSLVFVDSTGAPWPIEAYDIGNPTAFNIQWDKTSNTLMIQSTVLYTYGNMAVKLKGLVTPVMVTLVPGQKAVDYRVDLRVQGYGPNANPHMNNALPPSTSTELLNILDGVPPANSKVLKVEGENCQAWLSGGKMYVRTRLNVLSPGWTATLSSADGMHAYQMQQTPMLLVSHNGQVIQLKVEGL